MGRRQGQQELADAGVSSYEIRKWCKYLYDEQHNSYLLQISIAPLIQRAGFDHLSPSTASAPHTSVSVSHLVKSLLPKLVEYEEASAEAFDECTSFDEAKRKRLFLARGVYSAIRFMTETFIQCAAARSSLPSSIQWNRIEWTRTE